MQQFQTELSDASCVSMAMGATNAGKSVSRLLKIPPKVIEIRSKVQCIITKLLDQEDILLS